MDDQCSINLPEAIRRLVAQYADDGISAEEINHGYCADFADVLWRAYPHALVVLGLYDLEDAISPGICYAAT